MDNLEEAILVVNASLSLEPYEQHKLQSSWVLESNFQVYEAFAASNAESKGFSTMTSGKK